ncbi:MAG: neuraminidase-like domain-containing protein [Blastocatellia bacterium]
MQLQGKLAYLTANNADLTQSLQQEIGSPDKLTLLVEKDLYKADAWKGLLNELSSNNENALTKLIPPAYNGATTSDRLDAYAADLARKVRLTFPAQVIGREIETDALSLGDDHEVLKSPVLTFLKNADSLGFELGRTAVGAFVRDNQQKLFENKSADEIEEITRSVKKLHCLYQITPTDEALKTVIGLGFASAHDVTAIAYEDFLALHADKFPSLQEAQIVYRKAQQVSAVTLNILTATQQLNSSHAVYAMSAPEARRKEALTNLVKHYPAMGPLFGSRTVAAQTSDSAPVMFADAALATQSGEAQKKLIRDIPSMELLFGSLDFCECEHCRSVLSPAAYFVDLLRFLDPKDSDWASTLHDWKGKHQNAPYPFQDQQAWNSFLTDWSRSYPTVPYPNAGPYPYPYPHQGRSAWNSFLKGWRNRYPGVPDPTTEKKLYDVIMERRPDLAYLPLTCENTNNVLPYIDVVNEILEYYVANDGLTERAAHDTGNATTAELLAEPQNIIPVAYNKLGEVRYPLTLPFDLWLETARRFFDHFETSLWQMLELFRPTDDLFASSANPKPYYRADIFAEYLGLSPTEYDLFTSPTRLEKWYELYGYETRDEALTETVLNGQRVDLRSAKALSRRLGVSYKELVELVGTGFVNPRLETLVILRKLDLDVDDVYRYKSHPGYLPFTEEEKTAFTRRLDKLSRTFSTSGFDARVWLDTTFWERGFDQIVVLADSNTGCNFDLTTLRYADGTRADDLVFLKINLFVRLWKKLGWTIEETDRALRVFLPISVLMSATPGFEPAFGAAFKTALLYLAHLKALDGQVMVGSNSRLKLLTLWSNLSTTGESPLYAQLFLTRSVLKNDQAFDDPTGSYLSIQRYVKDHLPAFQGALGLTRDEIRLIFTDAETDLDTVKLSLNNVSLLYRYGLLAKALKLSVRDLIALKALTGLKPFEPLKESPITQLGDDSPFTQTLRFIEVAGQVKQSAFKIEDLDYLLRHHFDPVGKYREKPDALLGLAKSLAGQLGRIQEEHSAESVSNELLQQELAIVLMPDLLASFLRAVNSTMESKVVQDVLPAAFQSFANQLKAVLESLMGTVEYHAVRQSVEPADMLVPKSLAIIEPAIRVSYDQANKTQHLTFRGLLLNARKEEIKQAMESLEPSRTAARSVLASLLDTAQRLAQADALPLIASAIEMMLGAIEFTAVKENVLLSARLDPTSFERETRMRVVYDDVRPWDASLTYRQDDVISFNGSVWAANRVNTSVQPIEGLDWRGAQGRKQTLTFRGLLSDTTKGELITLVSSPTLSELLDSVQTQGRAFVHSLRVGLLAATDFDPLFASLVDFDDVSFDKRARLLKAFLPFILRKLNRQLVVRTLAADLGADAALTEALLTDEMLLADPSIERGQPPKPLLAAFACAGERGISVEFFDGASASLGKQTVAAADTTGKPNRTDSVRFEGYFEVPTVGAYRFFAVLDRRDAEAELRIGDLPDPVIRCKANRNGDEFGQFIELKAGVPYRFTLDARSLSGGDVALQAQGQNLPKGSLSRLTLYSQSTVDRVGRARVLLAKTLQLIQGLALSEREVRHMLTHGADFDDLDLSNLPTRDAGREVEVIVEQYQASDATLTKELAMARARVEHPELIGEAERAPTLLNQFLRLADYARLKRDIGGGTEDLITIFENARHTYSASSDAVQVEKLKTALINDVCKRFGDLTRRDAATVRAAAEQLGFAATSNLNGSLLVQAPDFAQEKGIQRLRDILQMVEKLGIQVTDIKKWMTIVSRTTLPEDKYAIARELRNTVKARYEGESWQGIAQSIFDQLRRHQRDALVAYVMHRNGFKNMEQLFEYFLIDPGMEPVVQTSRLRLAISSVQLFIQRCLLNLEPQVHPFAINSKHWDWMKRYRVWEANRKMFLFPENWLEPEFRDDKTHLFKELEGALLQGDVSNDLAEEAFFGYLKKLDQLARLEIMTMYCEERPGEPDSDTLHVIGRTYNMPHKYFYRRYSHRMWTPWEPVTAEIEGDHVVAVVWHGRLHLFWLTFLEKAKQDANAGIKIKDMAEQTVAASVEKQVEVQLNWSEYFQQQWTTRGSSGFDNPIRVDVDLDFKSREVFIHASKVISNSDEESAIKIHLHFYRRSLSSSVIFFRGSTYFPAFIDSAFRVVSKNSQPVIEPGEAPQEPPYPTGRKEATRYMSSNALRVTVPPAPKDILQQGGDFSLLMCSNPSAPELKRQFFYEDNQHTFFVEPALKEITTAQWNGWGISVVGLADAWRQDVSMQPQVPVFGSPIPPDPLASFMFQPAVDWATNPATVFQFNGQPVGQGGGLELQTAGASPLVNARSLRAGST